MLQARQALYLTYFHLNQQNIENRYCEKKMPCCQGSCHLVKQLKAMSGNEKAHQPKFPSEPQLVYVISENHEQPSFFLAEGERVHAVYVEFLDPAGYPESAFDPPESRV